MIWNLQCLVEDRGLGVRLQCLMKGTSDKKFTKGEEVLGIRRGLRAEGEGRVDEEGSAKRRTGREWPPRTTVRWHKPRQCPTPFHGKVLQLIRMGSGVCTGFHLPCKLLVPSSKSAVWTSMNSPPGHSSTSPEGPFQDGRTRG